MFEGKRHFPDLPASDQPVEAIGAGREEIARLIWQRFAPSSDMDEENALRGEYILVADDILAALSPASPARTPMGEPVAWIERQNDGTRYGEPKRWPPSDRARSYAQEMGRTIEPLYAAASPARTPMGGPQVLKGVGKINGDGRKDTTTIGEVVYVWNAEKPSPYAPGQYPRIWNEGWSASTAQYDFSPASIDEVRALAAPTPMGGPGGWLIRESDGGWLWTGTRMAATAALTEGLEVIDLRSLAPMGGEVEALREAIDKIDALLSEGLKGRGHGVWDRAERSGLRTARSILSALAASSPSPAQGGESGHVGTIEVLENLLRSGGETWLNREQEWALKSAIAALSASPQPEAGEAA